MNFRLAAAICALVMASSAVSVAQRARSLKRSELDPQITAALKDVSAARLRATVQKLVSFGNRNTLSANDPALGAAGKGVLAARDWIRSEFERYSQECGGCLEVRVDTFTKEPAERVPAATEISNVYAVLRGSADAERIYVVSGHYDSRNSDFLDIQHPAPGANDDASGTAVSLECARVLSKHKFPATIIFLAVAGEERPLNLAGSQHFAQMAKKKGWNIDGVLNNDIVGGDKNSAQDRHIVRVFSEGIPATATEKDIRLLRALGGESDAPSRQLARYVRETAAKYMAGPFGPKMVFRRDRYLRGGDHISFNEAGYAAVRFTEYREDYRHQHQNLRTESGIEYGDLPKFVDFEYLANVARLNAAVLASLASAPASPGKVRLLTRTLENDSTLEWETAPGATGYEVLWRPTTAAEWENVVAVGNVTRATLPRSKDNVAFAVRSVDAKGHHSLPVVPEPER